ncbi:CopD family protein [Herbaspirillum sp. RV1423]|uniref:CopD family protein n=1 Tax=Herbaspirillum sp. RV1423 TaxID=1443993 RepID=UPI0004BC3877|nr:CopD family protein [Herbaspirillum sp. RV1423]
MMYLWIKAFHVASVVTWIGGMLIMALVLPTLPKATSGYAAAEMRLLLAVRRWNRHVTSPAISLAWVLGVALVYFGAWHTSGWLAVKLVFALLLSALHGIQSGYLRRLGDAPGQGASALLKNSGVLTIAAVLVIAVMVVLKPF